MPMRAHTLLAFLATGCTWVSDADIEARRAQMDDDGDGFVKSDDCDDSDAKINPEATDTWYDGIDSDCAGDDDYDQDLDGYIADEFVGLITAGAEGTGLLPGGDCDDDSATVNPEGVDEWYDGVDTDCAGNDDYDQDQDGYVEAAAEGAATRYVDGSGDLPGGDCDDTQADVYPSAADIWYDGADKDCAGNEDYDQDGDGFVPDEYVNLTTRYVSGSGGLAAGDCDDTREDTHPNTGLTEGDPGFVTEAWGDGWDQDCAGDDDYDEDGDLFVEDAAVGAVTSDAAGPIDGTGTLAGGDCDNTNPEVNPDAFEVVTSATDFDCDGDPSTFAMGALTDYAGDLYALDWTAPGDLVFDANSTDVYLSVRTPEVEVTRDSASGPLSPSTYFESAFAFPVSIAAPANGIHGLADWWRFTGSAAPYSVTDGHDFIAEDDALYGLIGLQLSTGRALRLNGYNLTTSSRFGQSSRLAIGGSSTFPDFEDMTLALDDSGDLQAIACEANTGVLHYLRASTATLSTNSLDEQEIYSGISLESCEVTGDGELLGRGSTGLEYWTYDNDGAPPSFALDQVVSTYAPIEVEVLTRGVSSWTIMADAVTQDIVVLNSSGTPDIIPAQGVPRSLHAAFVGGATGLPDVVISYANSTGDAWFVRYDLSTGLYDEYQLASDLQALDVAVYIGTQPSTGDEFVLSAVASLIDLQYGWAWYAVD